MMRILETSPSEEELNKLGMFNLKKRGANREHDSLIVIVQKKKHTRPFPPAIFQLAKLEVMDNLQRNSGPPMEWPAFWDGNFPAKIGIQQKLDGHLVG